MKQGIPKSAREVLAKQASPEEHPSADLLNGYVEQSLTAGEKMLVMSHLAACGECREVVFLASGVAPEESISAIPNEREEAAAAKAPHRSNWIWRWKWAVPALAVFAIAAAVLIERDRRQPRFDRAVPEVAAVKQPTQSPSPQTEDSTKDLVISSSSDEKKAAAPPKEKRESTLENETYAKDRLDRDKPDEAARRQEPGQAQTRYWAMQQSQMARPQAAPSASAAGGRMQSQPQVSASTGTAGASQPQGQPQPANVPPTSQTVEVTGAAPLVQADKADLSTNFAANTPDGGNDLTFNQKPAAALKSGLASSAESASSLNKIAAAHRSMPPSAQWRISADGHLERAFSGGDWTRVLAEQPVSFRVVSVIGKDVWAGGNDGALFRSSDRGLSWDKVQLTAGNQPERGAIVSIRFDSALQGNITVDSGASWSTTDGGQTWSRR
ncbi:MAG TPA: YCF48-related protein [Terriglobales bacterium]|jgi:hypothetical protein|nr:YCF48-related protein [Terriglobales bacterium]